jgi:hypothetical protein
MQITKTTGGYLYPSPFRGPTDHTLQIDVDANAFSTAEVDTDGILKPGVPIASDGTLVGAAQKVYGVTIATIGQVSQDVVEDVLGRVLTADEIAGFVGTPLVLF